MTCCMRGVGSRAGDWARAEASRERPRMAVAESLRSMELLTRLAGIRFPIVRHCAQNDDVKLVNDNDNDNDNSNSKDRSRSLRDDKQKGNGSGNSKSNESDKKNRGWSYGCSCCMGCCGSKGNSETAAKRVVGKAAG